MFLKKNVAARIVFIMLLVAASYYPALNNGYIWDDDDYVTNNKMLRTGQGLHRIWFDPGATPQYYPLVHTTFWLEYHCWGLKPLGYHANNIILHGVNALLVWLLLSSLSVPGAWLAAALFAVHPVHVESVGWITERKNVLSAFFYLISLFAYLKSCGLLKAKARANYENSKIYFPLYILSLVVFICALLSKTVTCSLPAVVLLIIWWKRGCFKARDVAPLIPFFLIGIGFGLQTVWIEKYDVGARGNEFAFGFIERMLIAGRAFWFYLEKLIAPGELAFFYTRWSVNKDSFFLYLFPLSAIAGLVALTVYHKKIGRGPAAAMLFFAGTIFPALGFFNIAPMYFSFVADHFQYIASIGPLTLFASTLTTGLSKRILLKRCIIFCLLTMLGVLTWNQCKIYKNEETLWRDTIKKTPSSWIAYINLGKTLRAGAKHEEALSCYYEALRLKPNLPLTHSNLGAAFAEMGRYDSAVYHLQEAVRLYPEFSDAYYNLGIIFARQHKDEAAEANLLNAIKYKPDFSMAHYSLGLLLNRQNRLKEAAYFYGQALRFDPDNSDALKRLNKIRGRAPGAQ